MKSRANERAAGKESDLKKVRSFLLGAVLVLLMVFLGLLMASRYAQRDSMLYDAVIVTPGTQNTDTAPDTTPDA